MLRVLVAACCFVSRADQGICVPFPPLILSPSPPSSLLLQCFKPARGSGGAP